MDVNKKGDVVFDKRETRLLIEARALLERANTVCLILMSQDGKVHRVFDKDGRELAACGPLSEIMKGRKL